MNIKLKNKTRRRNKSRMSLRSVGGAPKVDELMSEEFVNSMHKNMWQFINLDTILYILQAAGCSTKTSKQKNMNNNVFEEHHKNTICFKGNPDEGHYVYVCPIGRVIGTYENDLLCSEDDGICHGAALAAALNECGHNMGELIQKPKSVIKKKINYRTIMNTYLYIIDKGWWDAAIKKYFGKELHWSRALGSYKETINAKKILTDFVETKLSA